MFTAQKSIGSGHDARSTAAEILNGTDLSGTVAIVTGGYSGIGLETTRAFFNAGANVIVPARDLGKAAAALNSLDNVSIQSMDLSDASSVSAFAKRFIDSGTPLHILVNSAGIMACPMLRDQRGYEMQFATNHLGHFQLTNQLLPALCRANGSRVVSVSSWGHRHSPVIFDDVNFEDRPYDPWLAYGQSKTANILFAAELDRRFKGDGVRSFSLHPGSIVGTGLERHLTREQLYAAGVIDESGEPILDPTKNLKTAEQGAATSVWCATSPQLDGLGGVYCENCDIAPVVSTDEADKEDENIKKIGSKPLGVFPYAIDQDAAQRLWGLSEELLRI